jgi:hypothetical protein
LQAEHLWYGQNYVKILFLKKSILGKKIGKIRKRASSPLLRRRKYLYLREDTGGSTSGTFSHRYPSTIFIGKEEIKSR